MAVCKSKNSIKTRYSTIASLVLSNSYQMKISRRKHGIPSMDLRKIIIDLKFSIVQDKRVYNNLSLSEKVKLKRFVKNDTDKRRY